MALPIPRPKRASFNERKATQIAGYLLKKAGGRMEHLKLIKLIYLIDREALNRRSFAVTDDVYFNLPHGPIVSEILRLAKNETVRDEGIWQQAITRCGNYEVELIGEVEDDELSEFELRLIDEVFMKFRHMTSFQLRDYTHDLPEYVAPNPDEHGENRVPLSVEDIMRALSKSPEEIEMQRRRAEAQNLLCELL